MADMKKSSNKRFGLGDIIIFGIILIMIIFLFAGSCSGSKPTEITVDKFYELFFRAFRYLSPLPLCYQSSLWLLEKRVILQIILNLVSKFSYQFVLVDSVGFRCHRQIVKSIVPYLLAEIVFRGRMVLKNLLLYF